MASSTSLEDAVSELMDSPGGQLLNSVREYLRKRATALVGLFLTGLVVGFPIAKSIVAWLIEEQRLPDDVNVIVTSPVEFLMLQIQLSASFGLMLAMMLLITETTLRGIHHPLVIERFKEIDIRPPKPSFSFIISIASSIILACCGILYAWSCSRRCCLSISATTRNKQDCQHNGNLKHTLVSFSIYALPVQSDFKHPSSHYWLYGLEWLNLKH